MIPSIHMDRGNFFALWCAAIFGSGWVRAAAAKNGALLFFTIYFIIKGYRNLLF